MSDQLKTPLKRCLTVLELTFLGLSLMISGIFLTIPTVVSLYAGPSVIFSFLLAGIAAVLSAFAYAEMGSRVPRAGSGYVYVSVSLGEFWGFLAGWNMILEYALTCAAMSRSFSSTLFVTILEPNRTFDLSVDVVILGERTDIIAACVVIFFTIIVASGVRLASVLNSIMNFSALTLVFCVCVVCFIYGDVDNWVGHGASTFFPHGFSGIVKGGAICYFSYIGFECITVSSEETLKPHRSIPLAIVLVFIVATIQYVTSSLAFTYFTPTSQFDLDRPLASLFHKKAFVVTGIVIGIAGILAVCTNIMVALYSMSRVCYAMASDGLLCKPFSYINSKTQTPIYGMAFSGIFVALMTYIFELHTLVEAVSVGTLVSYILVGIGVIVLRFEPGNMTSELPLMSSTNPIQDLMKLTEGEVYKAEPGTRKAWVKDSRFFNQFWPDVRPKVALGVMVMFMTLFALTEAVALRLDMLTWAWNTALAIPLAIVIIVSLSHLFLYEQNVPEEGTFRVRSI